MSKNNKVTNNPDPEVLAKPKRRTFTNEYKQRILKEYAKTEVGKKGAILRREGLYSSHIASWRRQLDEGSLKTQEKRPKRETKERKYKKTKS